MFKTSTCILLMITCLLTQYARQFSYLQCKVENFTTQSANICDCEKQYDDSFAETDTKLPPQKAHVHITLDEYYILDETKVLSFIVQRSTKSLERDFSFVSANTNNIFRPPQA